MQYQPFNNGFQNEQIYPCYPPPLPFTNIIGEGDVVSLMIPDGTMQFFFIPTQRRDRRIYTYHPFFGQVQGPVEAWLIRKNCTPTIPNVTPENFPYDPFLSSHYASKPSLDLAPQKPYYQKFHSDNVTSTTDIHYFFPRKTTRKHSTFVQVEYPAKYNFCSQTENIEKTCFCRKKKDKGEYTMVDTSSAMSIDEEAQTKERRKKNYKVRFKTNPRERRKCSCRQSHERVADQSDKKVSTYMDRSIDCAGATNQNSQTSSKGSKTSVKSNVSKSNSQTSCDSCCRTCFHCVTNCTSEGF